ncbi:MAG: hypothetical protein AAFX45_03950 [Pseudomonadota bacterium]
MRVWAIGCVACLTLSGCGGIGSSAINPLNWFGGQEEEASVLPQNVEVVRDARPVIAEITRLSVETVPGGAIVHARGLVPAPGWFAADLVRDPSRSEPGVAAFAFRAVPPVAPSGGTGSARVITAATYLSNGDLVGVREIRVYSASNIRATRP